VTTGISTAVPCPRCGTSPVAGDRFCETCGANLRERPTATAPGAADHVEITLDEGAAVSDRGHVRTRNEDAVALKSVDAADAPLRVAAVVCDGVSSVRSSELAARAAADAALDVLLGDTAGEGRTRSAVAAAAAAAAAVGPRGTPEPPACTLVCGVHDLADAVLIVGWVGDSRAYWLAEPGAAEPARLLTADHTAEAAAAAGTLGPALAAVRPDAITRWLGADGDAEPGVVALTPAGPGALLLCTDGLWKYLPDADVLAALALPALRSGGPHAAAAALTAAALTAGGADNVTVAVLPVHLTQEETLTPSGTTVEAEFTVPAEFTLHTDQNPYLAPGTTRVDAVVTLTATGGGAPADALEIIVVDCSGSMAGEKIRSARRATATAIAELRDGVAFAVVAGDHRAQQVYPDAGTARADGRTRAEAIQRVGLLRADGGTAIGAWLRAARGLADRHPDAVRHAILLTDGQNGEDAPVFTRAVQSCVGAFTCDCRGVGTDWRVDELRTVSSALLGTVDIVARPEDLAADFRALTGAAMARNVPDLWLRLWTPQGAVVRFVKQVAPAVEDLTDRRVAAGRQRGAYPLGAWGAERRDYHLCVDVVPAVVGKKVRAARVDVVRGDGLYGDDALADANVIAEWTDDASRSSAIDPRVAHYTGQVALAGAIADGLAAREAGDVPRAEERLGEAVRLAAESGHDDTARLLGGVVEVLDVTTGTVRLRADADKAGAMALDARSTRTITVGRTG
jgi:serine/threonine protein phosphatase PrpC